MSSCEHMRKKSSHYFQQCEEQYILQDILLNGSQMGTQINKEFGRKKHIIACF